MIDGKTISVLFNTYHLERYETLDRAVKGWRDQPVDQIWVVDGGNGAKFDTSDPRVEHIRVPKSIHTRGDYAMAYATDGDLLIFADDDMEPLPGLVKDMYKHYHDLGDNVFVSVMGRQFEGPRYDGNTKGFRSSRVKEPVEVDMVGITFMCPRWVLKNLDTRGMVRTGDDIWLGNICWPDVPKYVVPSSAWRHLPCAKGKSAIYRGSRVERYTLYEKVWNETYKQRKAKR